MCAAFALQACNDVEPDESTVGDQTVETRSAGPEEADELELRALESESLEMTEGLDVLARWTGEPAPDAEAAAAGPSCGTICNVGTEAGCALFGWFNPPGGIACGFASLPLCGVACAGHPQRKCTKHGGGKVCVYRDTLSWCDTQVDGHKVRAWRVMSRDPARDPIPTPWAPSRGCLVATFLDRVHSTRICVESEGCSAWIKQ